MTDLTRLRRRGPRPGVAHTATQTLGGATFVAGRLPGEVGAELLRAARESVVGGLHAAAVTAALVLLAAAATTLVFRRRFGPLEPTVEVEPTAGENRDERVAA